ncbi:MAG: hypothetical protein K9J06_09675 [Flavobacteriales bacterium]|nr:hypothetical protein [Flavobacteriales bacterium]
MKRLFPLIGTVLCLLMHGCMEVEEFQPNAAPWSMNRFLIYFGLSEEQAQYFIDMGIFDPTDTCTAQATVLPELALPHPALSDTLQPGTEALLQMMALLHTALPELYIDTGNTYTFDYEVTADNLDRLLQEGQDGQLAALCGEYAQFLQVIWQRSFPDAPYEMRIASTDRPDYAVAHTVNLLFWQENGVQYGLVADAMYGQIFPVDAAGRPVPLALMADEDGKHMLHLGAEVLNAKRFLTDRIWPCNLVNPTRHSYHHAPAGALRAYELLMPENIALLFPQDFTQRDYERELLRLLLAGRAR